MSKPLAALCVDCPFGNSTAQRHMRNSLRPGRFKAIAQAVWLGAYFPCHKTTKHDDDGEAVPNPQERMCAGAIQFASRARDNRDRRVKMKPKKPKPQPTKAKDAKRRSRAAVGTVPRTKVVPDKSRKKLDDLEDLEAQIVEYQDFQVLEEEW